MTTKITLTNIDSTGDYSELVDAAYNTANAASSYANAAFAQANNSTDTWVRSAANSASSYALMELMLLDLETFLSIVKIQHTQQYWQTQEK